MEEVDYFIKLLLNHTTYVFNISSAASRYTALPKEEAEVIAAPHGL